MSGNVKTYDPSKIVVIVGGVPIGGFSDGTFVKVSRSTDTFTKKVGADGDITRIRSSDKSGEMTITLDVTSPSNDVLSGFALADEISNAGIIPALVKDLASATVVASANGWVRKPADIEFGAENPTVEWTIDLATVQMAQGGYLL